MKFLHKLKNSSEVCMYKSFFLKYVITLKYFAIERFLILKEL